MYYVGNIPFIPTDELQHWGVLGMKWGVRRYQNADGTLTAAGKARYGSNGKYEYKSIGQKMAQKRYDKAKSSKTGQKINEAKSKLEAYQKRDADRQKYAEKTSTKKAIGQKALGLLTGASDVRYQRARSRGESRGKAIFTELMPAIGAIGIGAIGAAVGYSSGQKAAAKILKSVRPIHLQKAIDNAAAEITSRSIMGLGAGAAAGAVAGVTARRVGIMNANKKKYGHRLYT